jgi:hypothetical protein
MRELFTLSAAKTPPPHLQALLAAHNAATGALLRVDAYGSGEDAGDIRAAAADAGLDLVMHGGVDHLDARLRPYRRAPSRAAL